MKTRYEIRRIEINSATSYGSKSIGFKGKLFPRSQALKIAKRLKKAGVDAYIAPWRVAA